MPLRILQILISKLLLMRRQQEEMEIIHILGLEHVRAVRKPVLIHSRAKDSKQPQLTLLRVHRQTTQRVL